MSRRFLTLVPLAVLTGSLLLPMAAGAARPVEAKTGVSVDLGLRSDKLNWSIAGKYHGQSVNILSELLWDDLRSLQLTARGWTLLEPAPLIDRPVKVQIELAGGRILSGKFQDRDYAGNDRTRLFSEIHGSSDRGYTADLSAGLGPHFQSGTLSATPLVGYSFHMQKLTLTDGVLIAPRPAADANDPFADNKLDSRYRAYWHGPWIGIELTSSPTEKFHLLARFEYHWARYFAEANWNLRSDFAQPVSFEHSASGRGLVILLQTGYQLSAAWSWQISGKLQRWGTDSGTDRLYFADGRVGKTRLNQVKWTSVALNTGLEYRF